MLEENFERILDGGLSGKSGLCSSSSMAASFCEGGLGGGYHLQLLQFEASDCWAGLIKGSVGAAIS